MNEMYGRKIEGFDLVLLLIFLKNVKKKKKLEKVYMFLPKYIF